MSAARALLEKMAERRRATMAESHPNVKRVLVFGSAGTGKTTLINKLAKTNRETSSSAIGVTLSWAKVGTDRKDDKGNTIEYHIFDTAGLNEGENGMVPGDEAIKNLLELLKETKEGLNLLIIVTRGKITDTTTSNFNLFVKAITSSDVPVIIVETNLDDEEDPGKWADDNKRFFADQGMDAAEIVGTAFPRHNPKRDGPSPSEWVRETNKESTDRVWRAIEVHASVTPVDYLKAGGVLGAMRRTWNALINYLNKRLVWVTKTMVTAIQEGMNCDRSRARTYARQLVTN